MRAMGVALGGSALGALLALVLSPVLLLDGWVLSVLWRWFVTPTFPNIATISFAQAVGLMLIVNFLHKGLKGEDFKNADGETSVAAAFTAVIVGPLLVLALGWLVKTVLM